MAKRKLIKLIIITEKADIEDLMFYLDKVWTGEKVYSNYIPTRELCRSWASRLFNAILASKEL